MKEISSIRSSYVRYKESTQKLVRWLVTNVTSIPTFQDEKSQEQSASAKGKKRGGGKAKKGKKDAHADGAVMGDPVISIRNIIEYAKLIAQHSEAVAVPEAVYSLFESVIHARRMVASFYQQLDTSPDVEAKNESHLNFIRVLEEAFHILGGSKWRKRTAEERATARKQGKAMSEYLGEDTALHLSNRFAELEVEDVDLGVDEEEAEQADSKNPNDWISHIVNKQGQKVSRKDKQPKPTKVPLSSYKISEDLSANEEVSFAVWCFFVDMNSIRQYLKAVWNQVRKDNIDLVTASVCELCNVS